MENRRRYVCRIMKFRLLCSRISNLWFHTLVRELLPLYFIVRRLLFQQEGFARSEILLYIHAKSKAGNSCRFTCLVKHNAVE